MLSVWSKKHGLTSNINKCYVITFTHNIISSLILRDIHYRHLAGINFYFHRSFRQYNEDIYLAVPMSLVFTIHSFGSFNSPDINESLNFVYVVSMLERV